MIIYDGEVPITQKVEMEVFVIQDTEVTSWVGGGGNSEWHNWSYPIS